MTELRDVVDGAITRWRAAGGSMQTLYYYTHHAARSSGFAPSIVYFYAQSKLIKDNDDDRNRAL